MPEPYSQYAFTDIPCFHCEQKGLTFKDPDCLRCTGQLGTLAGFSVKEPEAMRTKEGKPKLSRKEFEKAYAARVGKTVEKLRSWGRVVRKCDCGDAICEGWQSVDKKLYDSDRRWRARLRNKA